jgi:hypothetical protein
VTFAVDVDNHELESNEGDNTGSVQVTVTLDRSVLVTKQVTIGLDILQSNNIPLENLIVTTLLSEDVLASGETTASVTVADVNKGQIAFVSNIDGNPLVVAYIPDFDIQYGTTSITLDSIADGFIMSNPLMFGFSDSDRLEILSYAKNAPLYQDLKQEITTALQTDPYNLLEEAIFPMTYGTATLLIIEAIKNIGGEALSQAVIEGSIIGQTDVPHLNDLGGGQIEAINPTMVFYGFDIAEQPEQARVIAGKDSLGWDLKLGFPLKSPITDPVKEIINLGENGHFTITFTKADYDNAAGIGAYSANFLKLVCIAFDVFVYCPLSNNTIRSIVEHRATDPHILSLIEADFSFTDLRTVHEVFSRTIELLSNEEVWKSVKKLLYGISDDNPAVVKFIKGAEKSIKNAKKVLWWTDKILIGYDAANQYIPFAADIIFKQNDISYCVTKTNGVLSATCQLISPTAIITMTTPLDQVYVGREVLFDASSSYDPVYSTGSLVVRWDFDNDRIFDTDWSTNKKVSWIYSNEDIYDVVLQVKNQDESVGFSTKTVRVYALTDPSVPAAPSDVSLAIVSDGAGIYVSWKDNSNNEEGFDIAYSPTQDISSAQHELQFPDVTGLSSGWGLNYDQNGLLMSGQTICFQVSAYNASGSSVPTPWSCITVP